MAHHQQRSRTASSASSRRLTEAQASDAQDGAWERRELMQMNERFAERMTRAAFTEAAEMAERRSGKRNS
jgi:hypothetical protein